MSEVGHPDLTNGRRGRVQVLARPSCNAACRLDSRGRMPELIDAPLDRIAYGHDRSFPNRCSRAAGHPWQHALRPAVTREPRPAFHRLCLLYGKVNAVIAPALSLNATGHYRSPTSPRVLDEPPPFTIASYRVNDCAG